MAQTRVGVRNGGLIVPSSNIIGVYNGTLTDSEVLQNYNATKGRFGL